MNSEVKRWTIHVCDCGGEGLNDPPTHWTHDGPHEVKAVEVVPTAEVERLRSALEQIADGTTPAAALARATLANDKKR